MARNDSITQTKHEYLKQIKETICQNCGQNVQDNIIFHHIVPLGCGGNDIETNLAALCPICHNKIHQITTNDNHISHSDLIKAGIARAKAEGKRIGTQKGDTFNIKKKKPIKEQIIKLSRDFEGTMTDTELWPHIGIARNTFYKYKKEIREERKIYE